MSQIGIEDRIFADYLQYRLAKTGDEAPMMSREQFYEQVYALHERFMAGEFSLGYMAQMLEITKPDLYHLLDSMSLKVTNV